MTEPRTFAEVTAQLGEGTITLAEAKEWARAIDAKRAALSPKDYPLSTQSALAFEAHLRAAHPGDWFRHEVAVVGCRADLLRVDSERRLWLYEFKGATDNCSRLVEQLTAYEYVADFVVVVVAAKHCQHVRAILSSKFPRGHVGLTVFTSDGAETSRPPTLNPDRKLLHLSHLFWVEEMQRLCTDKKLSKRGSKAEMFRRLLAAGMTEESVWREALVRCFQQRDWLHLRMTMLADTARKTRRR